jgi:Na+/H+-dicarboxylate symporter
METDAAAIAVGNAVATIVIAKWEKALDERKLQQVLNRTVDKAAFAQQPA